MALGRDDGREPLKAGEYCTSKPVFFCSPEDGARNQFVSREAYHAYKREGRPCGSREMRACFFGNQYVDPSFVEDDCEHAPGVGADCDGEPTPGRSERHANTPKARKTKARKTTTRSSATSRRKTPARVDPDAAAIDSTPTRLTEKKIGEGGATVLCGKAGTLQPDKRTSQAWRLVPPVLCHPEPLPRYVQLHTETEGGQHHLSAMASPPTVADGRETLAAWLQQRIDAGANIEAGDVAGLYECEPHALGSACKALGVVKTTDKQKHGPQARYQFSLRRGVFGMYTTHRYTEDNPAELCSDCYKPGDDAPKRSTSRRKATPAGVDPDAAAIDAKATAPPRRATQPKAEKQSAARGITGARCISQARGGAAVSPNAAKVKLPDGRTLTSRHMVVPVGTLLPSHGSIEGGRYVLQDNAKNGQGYPAEVQEDGSIQGANFTRDYARDTAFQQRLDDMFGADPGEPGAFDAELITSITPSANLGAPVAGCVGDKLVVFGGNNRTNILQRLMTTRGKRGARHRKLYREHLDGALRFVGIEGADKVKDGVHVRVLDDDETPQNYGDIVKLMDDMNAGEAAAAPIRDKMKAASAAMSDAELDTFAHMLRQLPEDGAFVTNLTQRTPITRGVAAFLLQQGLIPQKDARQYFADGQMEVFSEEGAGKVQALLQALAISDDGANDLLSSKTRMRAGIAKASPTLLAISRKDPAFVSELQTAMREVRDREASEVQDDTYWNTVDMFTQKTRRDAIPPRVWTLFQFIERNKTAQNVWPTVLRDYEERLDDADTRRTFEETNTALPGFGPDPGASTEADPFAELFNVAGLRRRRRSPGRRRVA